MDGSVPPEAGVPFRDGTATAGQPAPGGLLRFARLSFWQLPPDIE